MLIIQLVVSVRHSTTGEEYVQFDLVLIDLNPAKSLMSCELVFY